METRRYPDAKLRLEDLSMVFETKSGPFEALAPVNLAVAAGRFISLIGPSGCGKSTIFNIVSSRQARAGS
nr:ATP-binding cassette domain-containing protein [Martelella alba]